MDPKARHKAMIERLEKVENDPFFESLLESLRTTEIQYPEEIVPYPKWIEELVAMDDRVFFEYKCDEHYYFELRDKNTGRNQSFVIQLKEGKEQGPFFCKYEVWLGFHIFFEKTIEGCGRHLKNLMDHIPIGDIFHKCKEEKE